MLKRKSKRVLSIVLAVAMIVGLFPITAFAGETSAGAEDAVASATIGNETNYYTSFEEAVESVLNSEAKTGSVNLLKDSAGDGIKFPSGTNIIIDFGGYTYDFNGTTVGSAGTETQGFQCLKGSTIVLQNGTLTASASTARMMIQNYADLTLNNMNLDATVNSDKNKIEYVLSNNCGEVNIVGNTSITAKEGQTAFDVCYWPTSYPEGTQITVDTTGTIKGNIELGTYGDIKESQKKSTCSLSIQEINLDGAITIPDSVDETVKSSIKENCEIVGGTFSDPSSVQEYIAPGNDLDADGNVTVASDAEAQIDGLGYPTLADAVAAAEAGDTITLVNDVVLNGAGKGDTEGLLKITKNITIVGNGHKITATNVTVDTDGKGPSMINIQNNADVTLDHVVIDGEAKTKHGININNASTVTLNDVTVKNNRWYAVMDNESALELNGLSTSGNQWGINIDNKAGAASLIVNDATITEASSIVYDANDGAKIGSTIINGGCFQYIISNNAKATLNGALTINGGTFATGELPTSAINIADHLAPGLEFNPVTGQVYKEPEYTGKYSYEIFTTVGDNGAIDVDRYATEGDDVTITVSPDEAYLLDELTVTAGGKEVEVKDNGDGTYTFKMPSADAKIVVTFAEDPDWEPEPEEPAMPFTDVNDNDWFYDVVLYAYDNGLMTGVSATEFAPNQTTTRGMIVSMLARLEGVTSAEDAGFADVAENDWYATAVNWAASVGVVNGYEDNTFRPNAPITREQMAAILYNYADYKGYDVSARADLSDYADAASISSWAEDVLAWANAEGLINGMTATTIDPQGATTRAQTAAMFERFLTAHEA